MLIRGHSCIIIKYFAGNMLKIMGLDKSSQFGCLALIWFYLHQHKINS